MQVIVGLPIEVENYEQVANWIRIMKKLTEQEVCALRYEIQDDGRREWRIIPKDELI